MGITLLAAAIFSLMPVDASPTGIRDSTLLALRGAVEDRQSYLNGEPLLLPSLMRYAYRDNLTTARAGYLWRRNSQLESIPEGLAAQQLVLRASSFMHLSARVTTYGCASYRYERARDITFLNSSDFDITFPYTSATEAGGTNRESSYSFSGGCDIALPLGTLGLEVRYRAMQTHRIKDPRPLNIVSDFSGRVGFSVPLSASYLLAAMVNVDVYKQSCDVSVYNPQDEPLYLLMNGIGNSFLRHNISDSPTLYRLHGYGGMVALRPTGPAGVWGAARFTWKTLYRYAVNANIAPINFYTEPSWQAYLGYIYPVNGWHLGATLAYTHLLRLGNDYILGTSDVREYRLLGSVPNYAHERISLQMELAAVKAHCGGLRYILLSSFCQRLQNAPQIAITRVAMEHTLEGYAIIPLRRHSLRFDASLFGFVPLGRWNVQKLPVAYTAKALERYALRFVALRASAELGASMGAAGLCSLSKRFLLEIGLRGELASHLYSTPRYALKGTIALHFQ